MTDFQSYFEVLGRCGRPHDWQSELGESPTCGNRLIRIPTGFGKTLGVLAAWLWHRVACRDDTWPRRLVWCLPMRVLVEQTKEEAERSLAALGLLWEGGDHAGKVGVHVLMGGADGGDWHLYPEECAVLIGTQDMLLSRALNRGYGTRSRARWPMEFGLLNQDSIWIMDEVQLMDVGLATSAQLQAFRGDDAAADKFLRPSFTWWMSATLQPDWLRKSPDTAMLISGLPETRIAPPSRVGRLWDGVFKTCVVATPANTAELARQTAEKHIESGSGATGPTLVVLNTVKRALEVFDALEKEAKRAGSPLAGTDLRLIHSRFRPAERAGWRGEFLDKEACAPNTNRIIVATQVIEAGVDFSAGLLVTELAPWASLVQRFGRCARWGGSAQVVVADFGLRGDKDALPYDGTELEAALEALGQVSDVAPLHLESFEEAHPELLPQLYPYEPAHLLLRHELDELFDTTPDLTGSDIDISRFIRSGEERDLQVFWAEIPAKSEPSADIKPVREALCAVPFLQARNWLCGEETKANKKPRLKDKMRAWVWDWLEGQWRRAERRDLYPGQTALVAAECGGYDPIRGWNSEHHGGVDTGTTVPLAKSKKHCWRLDKGKHVVADKKVAFIAPDELADAAQDSEELSVAKRWKTIAVHGQETGQLARDIATTLAPSLAGLCDLAGRWHDAGKAHEAFQVSMRWDGERPFRDDLAKAPDAAWPCSLKRMYSIGNHDRRPGFRHELASTLALFAVLQRHDPDHKALLGDWRELLAKAGLSTPLPLVGYQRVGASSEGTGRDSWEVVSAPNALEGEILALDAPQFDLLAYLVCAHHGKVRVAWHASPADQAANDSRPRIRGLCDGDELPPLLLTAADGTYHELPATLLDLAPAAAGLNPRTGRGWTERVLGLLQQYGPFTLAWLEALLRAADQRASRSTVADPLLENHNADHGLETSDRTLAEADPGRAATHPFGPDSPQSGSQHGLRGGTGGREDAGSRTQAPHHATRYLTTTLGILSYAELAPHLAVLVLAVENEIAQGCYDHRTLDEDLIREFHHRICGDLVPDMAGRWRQVDVQVSDHHAPVYPRVPTLMRDYCLDLQARLAALEGRTDDRIPEFLAFAEGRLLWIHPFPDFNGRATRLLLAELLQRLGLPALNPTPDPGEETERYLLALKAADRADWQPLIDFWLARFYKEAQA